MNLKDIQKLQKIAQGGKRATTTAKDLEVMAQLEGLGQAPLTAADRAMVGKLAAEATKKQPVTKLSEALGNVGAEGKKLRVTQTDRTAAKYLGGAPFSMMQQVDPRYADIMATWGVKTPSAATNIINQSDPDIIWSTLIGAPTQHRSNELIFNKLYKQFQKSVKEGNLSPELRAKFNAELEPLFGEGADILDPSFRKKINTFEERAAVGNLLLGKGIGGELRGGSIIPGRQIMDETTEPMLRDVETFSIGPRLFTLNKGVVSRPDIHPAFPEILQGEDLKQLFVPPPNEIALPTFNEEFRKRTGRKKPGYYDLTATPPGEPYPTQFVDDKYLTHLQKEGFAHGGAVKMANGGNPPKYVPPSQLFPLKSEPQPKGGLQNIMTAAKDESATFGDKGATMDIINRGPVADALGSFVDLANMPLQGLDYLASKIPAFSKPASVMEPEGERVPIARVSTDEPYGGSEAWKKQFQKSGITSMTERPLTEMAVSLASPLAPFAASKALKAGKALAPTAGKLAQEFAESTQFGLPFELNVVKPKGGNWTTSLSPVRDLKRRDAINGKDPEEQLIKYNEFFNNPENLANTLPEEIAILENKRQKFINQVAINKWLDTKLTNYIKNEMATPEDSIRLGIERRLEEAQKVKEANDKKLANMKAGIDKRKAEGKDVTLSQRDYEAAKEKADEENIFANKSVSHLTAPDSGWNASDDGLRLTKPHVDKNRVDAGYPVKGMGKNQASQQWEDIADEAVEINPASQYLNEAKNEKIRKSGGTPTIDAEPWIAKVAEKDPNTPIYYANNISIDHRSDFRHMIDELQEAMNPNSKLPNNLKITAKDLEKMTVDDVSALSGKISAWRDIQKRKIDKDVANNPAMHTFKEYTENNPKGVKWQQIKRPEGYDDQEAEQYVRAATQYEGDLMRHCVGGSGHCDPLLDGEVEIYTLRDARGEPHVTIEVSTKVDPQAKGNTPKDFYLSMPMGVMAKLPPMPSPTNASFADITYWERKVRQTPQYQEWLRSRPKDIGEIKGKGNKKPNEEYIPFIQDFIKSGNWGNIRDLQNSDLIKAGNKYLTEPEFIEATKKHGRMGVNNVNWETARKRHIDAGVPEEEALANWVEAFKEGRGTLNLPREGFSKGGAVQSPNGFDYESHVNKLMDAHNLSNFDYEGHVNKIMGMAEGGAAYNTSPDMSDGGLSIQAPAFKIGGRIPLLTR
jgi:hypothetical protein